MFDKVKMKNLSLCLCVFLVGMLSVSISNIFGGYYAPVTATVFVLGTVYVSNIFNLKESCKENLVMIGLVGIIALLELVFFIVNDIANVDVYVKNYFNFWSICVLISQIISMGAIVYSLSVFVIENMKTKVEIVDEDRKIINNTNNVEKQKETYVHEEKTENYIREEIEVKEDNIKKESKPEIKSIEKESVKIKTPFMEEEK